MWVWHDLAFYINKSYYFYQCINGNFVLNRENSSLILIVDRCSFESQINVEFRTYTL